MTKQNTAIVCEPASVPDGFESTLRGWCSSLQIDRLALSCFDSRGTMTFRHGSGLADGNEMEMSVACLAKTMTMTLVQEAASQGRLDIEQLCAEFLPMTQSAPQVRLVDLLCHVHGLDGEETGASPSTADGRIDAAELLHRAKGRWPIAAAGEHYSYGDFGYMLLGAVLEQVYDRPYGDLLGDWLVGILGPQFRGRLPADPTDLCPSRRGQLVLSAPELAAILRYQLQRMKDPATAYPWTARGLADAIRPFPGWSPIDEGVALCWRYHRNGWFGHSGRDHEKQMAIVRFNPELGMGFAITSGDARAYLVAEQFTAILSRSGYRTKRPSTPKPVAQPVGGFPYCGTYLNGGTRLSVDYQDGTLQLKRSSDGHSAEPAGRWSLKMCEGEIGFASPPDFGQLYWVQFLGFDASYGFSWLWNGTKLWRRINGGGDGRERRSNST